ncbi:MAG: hypothetical protein M0Q90_15750 [Bacteroidales bacterium]|nr:hypothetical protein [Bacteroidales bacterium]
MKKLIIVFFTVILSNALCTQTVYQTYTVTGIETWDLTTHPNGVDIEEQLIIEDSALLTIHDLTVRFDPYNAWDGNVEVKAGGKLAAYNTTFQNRGSYFKF